MKKGLLACLCTFALFYVHAFEVELSLADSQLPIALVWESRDQTLEESFVSALHQCLRSDLARSGRLTLSSSACNSLHCHIEQGALNAWLTSLGQNRHLLSATISGDFALDCAAMHQLADLVQEELLGVRGVASLRILYTEKRGEWSSLVQVNADGAGRTLLFKQPSLLVTLSPYPDGKGFFFVSYETGQAKIYSYESATGLRTRFSSLRGNQWMPHCNRDQTAVAFVCDASGRLDIFVQPLGKLPRQVFTSSYAAQSTPSFHPDGETLAFVSDKDGSPRIYLMEMGDPGSSRLLTYSYKESTAPNWSPDGKTIAFAAKVKGVRQICLFDLESGKETQLTAGPGNKENPCWAPDNFHLVYNCTDEKGCQIFRVNVRGEKPLQVTQGPGEKRYPIWIRTGK